MKPIKFKFDFTIENRAITIDKGSKFIVDKIFTNPLYDKVKYSAECKPRGKKRSLDANALMWSLYQVLANVHHCKILDGEELRRESMRLYTSDMVEFAPCAKLTVGKDILNEVLADYSVYKIADAGDSVDITIWLTSSKWDVDRMTRHIDRLFNRLADIDSPDDLKGDVRQLWIDWQHHLDKQINKQLETQSEYKQRKSLCEACGVYVGESKSTGSSFAHIKARGMGGKKEDARRIMDGLHLCDKCHMLYDNGKGKAYFLSRYPHLTNRVNYAN
jgi:hypothetical protein